MKVVRGKRSNIQFRFLKNAKLGPFVVVGFFLFIFFLWLLTGESSPSEDVRMGKKSAFSSDKGEFTISHFRTEGISTQSIRLAWSYRASHEEVRCEVYLRELLNKSMSDHYTKVFEGSSNGAVIENLRPSTPYEFYTKFIIPSVGFSKESSKLEVKTSANDNLILNPSFEESLLEDEEKYFDMQVGDKRGQVFGEWIRKGKWKAINDLMYVKRFPLAKFWQPFSLGYFLAGQHQNYDSKAKKGKNSISSNIGIESDTTGAFQYVSLNQTVVSPVTLSAWSYSENVKGNRNEDYAVHLDFKYTDGSWNEGSVVMEFDPSINEQWKHECLTIVPPKPIAGVSVFLIFRARMGKVFFDDVKLFPSSYLPSEEVEGKVCVHQHIGATPAESHKKFFIRKNYFAAQNPSNREGITISTQLTTDRIGRLVSISEAWNGHISAAIYVNNPNEDIFILSNLIQSNSKVKQFIDFHLVYANGGLYPANVLRNIALETVKTRYSLLLDIDFVPSQGLYDEALRHIGQYRSYYIKQVPRVYVIAAFEMKSEAPPPKTKTELLQLIKDDKANSIHARLGGEAHKATDYEKWITAEKPYEIQFTAHYEPYLLVENPAAIPLYDERFEGYGHDKECHSYELWLSRYSFLVLPNVFIVHLPHRPASWKSNTLWLQVEKNWYTFIYEALLKHNASKW
eukprot:TRINITY_DN6626_c0_g1_i1.p1 TRINITY_DN6626_c0_g1~~TRINITY_DN6626_c0_g1_i1.p1  ORF type:complete len:681 (-),score=128.84 TRINITY_DN6626_c0_g1_i1:88-2130(-)